MNNNRNPRVKAFGIAIDSITLEQTLDTFNSGVLVTPNVDHLMLLKESAEMRAAYEEAEFVLTDSQILFFALKLLGKPVPEKISGSDFLPAYCHFHAKKQDKKIFILGGKPGVARAAMQAINRRCEVNIVVGEHSPSMTFASNATEIEQVTALINESDADALVVGLGSPKQEIFIHQHRHKFQKVRSFLAVGASIDFEAGNIQRAPSWMSRFGLEWLFRLIQEPGRLWKRYLVRDIQFLRMFLREVFPKR